MLVKQPKKNLFSKLVYLRCKLIFQRVTTSLKFPDAQNKSCPKGVFLRRNSSEDKLEARKKSLPMHFPNLNSYLQICNKGRSICEIHVWLWYQM